MLKNIKNFCASPKTKPLFSGFLLKGKKLVATDSFKLIEMDNPFPPKEPAGTPEPAGIITLDKMPAQIDNVCLGEDGNTYIESKGARYAAGINTTEKFPEYEKIFPQDEPVIEVLVNPEYLAKVAEFYAKNGKKVITLKIHGKEKPIEFVADDMRALLMPCKE